MKGFILLVQGICLLHTISAVTHSMQYIVTAVSGLDEIPEHTEVGMVDGQQFVYYDSVLKKIIPKTDWIERNMDASYWKRETDRNIANEQIFKSNVAVAMTRFNQTRGVHIAQMMYGCEWDDVTRATEGFNQHGYDGEDFIAFDLKTLKWIAPTPQAVITKHKWDSDMAYNEQQKNYLTQVCIDWLKKYVDYGKSTLMRTVPPSVYLLQKTPSSPVTCHATGFYPSGVMVSWQKDGQDHHDVEHGEILQNDDGTFQKSSHLTVTPEEWKKNKYQCVVQVTGLKEDTVRVLTESEVKTNWDDPGPNIVLIIGVVVALLLVIVAVVGVVIWKKKTKKGFVPASTSDTDSDNSGRGAQKI